MNSRVKNLFLGALVSASALYAADKPESSMQQNEKRACPTKEVMYTVMAVSPKVGHKFLNEDQSVWSIIKINNENLTLDDGSNSSGRVRSFNGLSLSNSQSKYSPTEQICYYRLSAEPIVQSRGLMGGHIVVKLEEPTYDTSRAASYD